MIEKEGRSPGLEIEIHAGRTPELIRLARVAWAVSGSVGLELMVEALPSVVLYKIRRFDLWVASFFIKSRYISLVNLLADTELFPEYLTWRDVSDDLVRWALSWLDDPTARNEARAALATLRYHVARPGASDRAAERIVSWLGQRSEDAASRAERGERSPHFSRLNSTLQPDHAGEPEARDASRWHLAGSVQANVNVCTPCPGFSESLRSRSPQQKKGNAERPLSTDVKGLFRLSHAPRRDVRVKASSGRGSSPASPSSGRLSSLIRR